MPVIHFIVSQLKEAGIEEVLIVVGRNKEILENYFDRNVEVEERLVQTGKAELLKVATSPHKIINISFVRQIDAKGTGYAAALAKNFVAGEPFMLMYGDEVMFGGVSCAKQLIKAYNNCYEDAASVIAVCKVPRQQVSSYGIVAFEKTKGKLVKMTGIVEKPKISEAPSSYSYIGPAILNNEIFDEIAKIKVQPGEEIGITSAYDSLAKKGKMCALMVKGKRFDVGSPLGLIKANVYAASKDKKLKKELALFLLSLYK